MKTLLIFLFSISFINNTYTQGSLCYFDDTAIVNQKVICKRQCYNFNANDIEYIVSYSANEDFNCDYTHDCSRNLYLYRWDSLKNSWIIASDIIQTDYTIYMGNKSMLLKITSNNYDDARNVRKQRIKVLNNGCIILLLENYYIEPADMGRFKTYNSIIVLVPDGNKFKSTRFELYDNKCKNFPYNSIVYENINNDANCFNYELNFYYNNKALFVFEINDDESVSLKNKYANSIYIKNK